MSSGKALSRFHQPISVPGRRLQSSIPLKFVAGRVGGGGGKSVNSEIPLVPFIDFLLCIVLFLLASFSASGQITLDKDVKLPSAENVEDLVEVPMVAVTGSQVLLDGVPAGSTRAVVDANQMATIDELFERLKQKRELAKQLNPGKPQPGVVILQIDRRVPALVVKSVFQTAALAGFPNVSFMVKKR